MEYDVSAQNVLTMAQCGLEFDVFCPDTYGTIIRGNRYLGMRLRNHYWVEACNDDKKKALLEATNIIDTLNFAGMKAQSCQIHQFPRATYPANFPWKILSTVDQFVPHDIEMACYEISLQLLSGIDPEMEVENLATQSHGFSQARTTYAREFVLEHIAAGVPSFKAWTLLKPYLRDPGRINISRVEGYGNAYNAGLSESGQQVNYTQ